MPIPDYETVMLPLLRALADGNDHRIRDVRSVLAEGFQLTPEEQEQLLPSGQQAVFSNRVGWARTYLKEAGLIAAPRRGVVRITSEGQRILQENPGRIDQQLLERYPSFTEFRERTGTRRRGASTETVEATQDELATPEETLDGAYRQIRTALAEQLLERLIACTPQFFEKAVLDLLLAMGYGGVTGGGSLTSAGSDQGIDGVIKEDKLGLDVVCIQAKRYTENTVGRPAVQAFVGSMDYHRAKKGVMLTTSQFSSQAFDFLKHIEAKKVVLIGGKELAELMIDHGIGVVTQKTYSLCEVSDDYFDQDNL
jgi:restriction system protein